MIDIRRVRDDFDGTAQALRRRGVSDRQLEEIRALDERRRALIAEGDNLRAEQREGSRRIGAATPEERDELIAAVKAVSARVDDLEPQQAAAQRALDEALEPSRVDRIRRQPELVAAIAGDDRGPGVVPPQRRAKAPDVVLDALWGPSRGALAPQAVDQLLRGYGPVGAQREHREERPLLGRSELQRVAIEGDLEEITSK